MKDEFSDTFSYNIFTELVGQDLIAMSFFKTCCLGESTGISFVDYTAVRVCKLKRIRNNKVFKGIANTGKFTTGCFHGFKLHIVINDKGRNSKLYYNTSQCR